jgi:hypothetical protein
LVWDTAPPPDVSEPESKMGDATTGTDADRADVQTRFERQPHNAGTEDSLQVPTDSPVLAAKKGDESATNATSLE